MTTVDHLDDLARAISTQSSRIRAYALAQAAATQAQELEIRALAEQLATLSQPVAAPPPATNVYGAKVPKPFAEMTGTEMVCRTWEELNTARQKTGVAARVIRLDGLFPVPVNVNLLSDTYVHSLDRTKHGITGGRFLIDGAQRVRIRSVQITGGTYDGVKIGDNAPSSFVDLDDLWIHDVGDQGVLTGWQPTADIWVRNSLIERVGLTPYPVPAGSPPVADGHCLYLGGPTSRWTITGNVLRPKAFAVQCYPLASDVLISQNTMYGGDTRGGTVLGSNARSVRSVGNIIAKSASAAFEVGASATGWADDCLVWACAHGIWEPGYKQLPGGNIIVAYPMFVDAAAGDFRLQPGSPAAGLIRQSSWDYVSSADAGAYRVPAGA